MLVKLQVIGETGNSILVTEYLEQVSEGLHEGVSLGKIL